MVPKENLSTTKMMKGEGVTPYLTRIWDVGDELAAVGEKPKDNELVRITLNGFMKEWAMFVQGINWMRQNAWLGTPMEWFHAGGAKA